MWRQFLSDEELSLVAVDADNALLMDALDPSQAPLPVRLMRAAGPVYPSRIPALAPGERGLLVAPTTSNASAEAARLAGWGVVTDDGTMDVMLRTRRVTRRPVAPPVSRGRRGRVPWARWAVGRVLLAQSSSVTQMDLAAMTGASQPTVSRLCRALHGEKLVELSHTGVSVHDWAGLAKWWLDGYPGHGGPVDYWYGLDPVVEQMAKVAEVLPNAAFSGSAAADLLSPWQRPDQVVVYTKTPALLGAAGFVPVADIASATVVVAAPVDSSVWCNSPITRQVGTRRVQVADPLQVVFDVLHGPDSGTRGEAADRILRELHGPLRAAWTQAWRGASRREGDVLEP